MGHANKYDSWTIGIIIIYSSGMPIDIGPQLCSVQVGVGYCLCDYWNIDMDKRYGGICLYS